jgi:flagellar hook-associated protein 1 FlgK
MGDLALNIAAGGLDAQQTAMDTVAEDLANVNTSNYIQQQTNFSTLSGAINGYGVGGGVTVTSVSQVNSVLAQAASFTADGLQNKANAYQQLLTNAQEAFSEPTGNGIQAELSTFWAGFDAIANNPTQLGPYEAQVSNAQVLATSLNQASSALGALQGQAVSQIEATVTQVNSTLQQVAQLNQAILQASGSGGDTNSLDDQMNQLAQTLTNDAGITLQLQSNGTYNAILSGVATDTTTTVPPGAATVQGTWTLVSGSTVLDTLKNPIAATGAVGTSAYGVGVDSTITGSQLPISSGTIGGLIQGVSTISGYIGDLDNVASNLATNVNNQLTSGSYWGVPPAGAATAGVALFTGATAASITVNPVVVASPDKIAVAGPVATTTGALDGSNGQALAALATLAGGPDQVYQGFITTLGSNVSQATDAQNAQDAAATAADGQEAQISGVDPNQEEAALVNYQTAYQADAKVVTLVQAAIDSLLAAVA